MQVTCTILKMTSKTLSTVLLLLFFITIIEAGHKKQSDKIVIEVPYKIYKHHHTHTKYKVITVPEKKEKTIIYFKPVETPKAQVSFEGYHQPYQLELKRQPKFMPPPHQQAWKTEEIKNSDHQYDQIFSPAIQAPIVLPSFAPHVVHGGFLPPVLYQPWVPPKTPLQDSLAHGSGQVYKTTLTPKPPVVQHSYRVREPNQENVSPFPVEHQHKFGLQNSVVPFQLNQNPPLNVVKQPFKKFKNGKVEDDTEYEHVGWLVIDGNSKKIVGKNFKEEFRLKG